MKDLPTVTWEVHLHADQIEAGRWTRDNFGIHEQEARAEYEYFKAQGREVKLVKVTSTREVQP